MLLIILLLCQDYNCNKITTNSIYFRFFEIWTITSSWNYSPEAHTVQSTFPSTKVVIYNDFHTFDIPPPRFANMKRRYQKQDPTKSNRGGKSSTPPISRDTSPRSDPYRNRRPYADSYYGGEYGPQQYSDRHYDDRRSENRRSPPTDSRRKYGNGYSRRPSQYSRPNRGDDHNSRYYDDTGKQNRDRRRLQPNQNRPTSRKYHYGDRQHDRNHDRSKSPRYSPDRPRHSRQQRNHERTRVERQGLHPKDWIVVTHTNFKTISRHLTLQQLKPNNITIFKHILKLLASSLNTRIISFTH